MLNWYKLCECRDLNYSSFVSVLSICCYFMHSFTLLLPHSVLVPPKNSPIKKLITDSGLFYVYRQNADIVV